MEQNLTLALTAFKETHPDEAATIDQVFKKDVITLGTHEAFALRDDGGEIRAFQQRLRLEAGAGLVQPVTKGPYVISAQGYEQWAEAAGACVIFPKEVLCGQKWKPNPYADRDRENGRILAVHARAVAFRFSSKGIPQVADWSTIFDTPSYRMIDLLAKAKKYPQAFRLLPNEMDPATIKAMPGDKDTAYMDYATWARYPFDESTSLYVNTAHEEALTWFSQILNREKKAMDFAQTFARRNALKHLSGLQKVPGQERQELVKFYSKKDKKDVEYYKTITTPAPVWDITVLCWRPMSGNIIKWDATQYAKLQDRVGGMIAGPGDDFQSNSIKLIEGAEATGDEPGREVVEADFFPEDAPAETEPEEAPEPHPAEAGPKDDKVANQYAAAEDDFADEIARAKKEMGITGFPISAQKAAILHKVNEYLNSV